jgi:protein ImuB
VLLRERLARFALPAPTLELRLHAADIAKRAPPNTELFPTPRSEREGLLRLIERLQARLGHERVQCLAAVDDHRPELATVVRPADAQAVCRAHAAAATGPATTAATTAAATATSAAVDYDSAEPAPGVKVRPVWLLNEGEPLHERDAKPLLEGQPLDLLSGPERIESGWWDGGDVRRDYYVLRTAQGQLAWAYRAAGEVDGGWMLQGWFA